MSLEASIACTLASMAPESIQVSTDTVNHISLDGILSPKLDDKTIAPWNQEWGAPPVGR